jgi:hypothetical protein
MINSSYESSNLGVSNGSKIVSIALILTALSLLKDLNNLLIISESSNWIPMIFARLDLSHQEDSIVSFL